MDNPYAKRPPNTPYAQQRLKSWTPLLTSYKLAGIYMSIAVLFLTIGFVILDESDNVKMYIYQYDGDDSDGDQCKITSQDEGLSCQISFNITETIDAPVYVFYEIDKFYQNHRRYVSSYSQDQLLGSTSTSDVSDCSPLTYNGSLLLSPCGLIANTLFNDVIALDSDDYTMDETGIAWESDDKKFVQPDGFTSDTCSGNQSCSTCLGEDYADGCDIYTDSEDVRWAYYYPNVNDTQYLYQSFPDVVTPIDGVKNEHFMVWMRTAGLDSFRKPYGIIYDDIDAGTTLTFNLTANWLVSEFEGRKYLVISNTSWFGLHNPFLGRSFIAFGVFQIFMAAFMLTKERFWPRLMGDPAKLFS